MQPRLCADASNIILRRPTRKAGRWSILLDIIRKLQHVSWVEGRFLTIEGSNCVQTVTKVVSCTTVPAVKELKMTPESNQVLKGLHLHKVSLESCLMLNGWPCDELSRFMFSPLQLPS
ncbi:unnamed protein product [Larinioides sclopetarius]|uniref:Uncharacterized protein n=1 Tax=Larinioides sclopetarius TaxID=280406 RepID=A0AAV2BNU9_9ARAC